MDASPAPTTALETPLGKLVKSLPDRLAERVLEDVMTGRLRPGDRLKEEILAQTHAVSRATVCEALIALARQGYVVRIPRSGARIAEFYLSDLDDLFELRAALLSVAAGRFARRAAPSQQAELEALVIDLEGMATIVDMPPQDFATQSVRIQTFLTERCGNNHLPDMYKRLAGMGMWQLIRGQASSFLTLAGREESAADWRRLADCVMASDDEGAEQAGRLLLEHSAVRVRMHFDEAVRAGSEP